VKFITTESVEALYEVLMDLAAGQSVCISASDFRKLTGDEIAKFTSEGRLMMGNLSARANCTIETTDCAAQFTKNLARPVSGVWPSLKADLSVRRPGSSSQ
jgi:hypothetical protein